MNRKSLFDLNREYLETLEELEAFHNETGRDDIPEELYERLNINQDELDEKLENYFYLIKELEHEIDTLKAEAKRLLAKAKSKQTTIDNLKKLMADSVKLFGETTKTGNKSYKHTKFSVSVIFNSPVVIQEEDSIPSDYKKFEFATKDLTKQDLVELKAYLEENPDLYEKLSKKLSITGKVVKKNLKSALQEGKDITGASIDKEAAYIKFQ